MTMRKFLPLLATAAAAAALATGCVTNGAITTLDLTDTNGETLQSVSEWDPGESHTYSMPTLPDGCEVNIVSSDPSLLSAELSEGTLTLTAENTGKAILTVEVALDGNTFSKSYEVQISDRQLQVGVTLIDSRTIADPNNLEDSYRPAQPSLGGRCSPTTSSSCRRATRPRCSSPALTPPAGNRCRSQSAVTVRTASEETGFDAHLPLRRPGGAPVPPGRSVHPGAARRLRRLPGHTGDPHHLSIRTEPDPVPVRQGI